jgi:ubiquinone/menaquinone biosynthesis C-methylase UbiE
MASHIEAVSTAQFGHEELRLQCPRCGGWIGNLPNKNTVDTTLVCSDCCFKIVSEDGIWNSLLPERFAHFSRFIKKNLCDPAAQGLGNAGADYYLALPHRDLSGQNSQQWSLRALTFRYVKRHVLPHAFPSHDGRLKILDLGAGTGWLSYRLALEGYSPIAVDLLTNDRNGLGAAAHYRKHLTTLFPRFQADFDTLPFVDDEFDLVIYNASFHYSANYERTLAEALRCTRANGTILIADTPWYSSESDPQQILAEYRELYVTHCDLSADTLSSLGYLTDKRLQHMEASFGIHWQVHTPHHGVQRLMRQVITRLQGDQDSAQLRTYSARARK